MLKIIIYKYKLHNAKLFLNEIKKNLKITKH